MDEAEGVVILAKKRCIYCSPEKWEKMRRKARKARISISRLVILCCRRAGSTSAPPEPPGHPLALSEDAQRGLHEESRLLARSTKVVIDVQGGAKVTLALHEVVRFLLLCEEARGS